jgi:hypothetical protein
MTESLNCAGPALAPARSADASSTDHALTRELTSAAAAITAYLTQRRILEERRATRGMAMVVFFASLFISFTITRVLTSHGDVAKTPTRVGVLKVDHQVAPASPPPTSL